MEKFEKEMEILLGKKISRLERSVYLKYSKVFIKKSMNKIRELNRANKKIDKATMKFKGNLKVVDSKLKLLKSQLKILDKKKKFLLNEIKTSDKNKKMNDKGIVFEKKELARLKKNIGEK